MREIVLGVKRIPLGLDRDPFESNRIVLGVKPSTHRLEGDPIELLADPFESEHSLFEFKSDLFETKRQRSQSKKDLYRLTRRFSQSFRGASSIAMAAPNAHAKLVLIGTLPGARIAWPAPGRVEARAHVAAGNSAPPAGEDAHRRAVRTALGVADLAMHARHPTGSLDPRRQQAAVLLVHDGEPAQLAA